MEERAGLTLSALLQYANSVRGTAWRCGVGHGEAKRGVARRGKESLARHGSAWR